MTAPASNAQTTTAVRERAILFSGEMVRAILSGRKTQTRRVVKNLNPTFSAANPTGEQIANVVRCPYGQPGDRLWVRETWANAWIGDAEMSCYAADHSDEIVRVEKWKPSIHMPRRLSRITLEITDLRVERVQEVSGEDVLAEGVGPVFPADPTVCFAELWDSINAKRQGGAYSWESNPWVWVLSFRRTDA